MLQLELKGIEKFFTDGRVQKSVLKSIDFTLQPGALVFITGPSGCGKTTLLNVIGLLEAPDKGTVLFDKRPINWKRKKYLAQLRQKEIGFIYQNFNLVFYLTVLDNILLPFYTAKIPFAVKQRALEILDALDIIHLKDNYPLQCSGGEKQRIAIARAFLKNPGLILADEPTGELDRENTVRIMELLREVNRTTGCMVIIVTHDHDLISASDTVYRLTEGRLV